MQGLLYLDAIIIARYTFLFHVKNPTALQDDFWRLFPDCWTLGVSISNQIIYGLMPGKNPQNYYMCLGHYPTKYNGKAVKINYSTNYLALLSFVAHVIAGIRIKIHRCKEEQKDQVQAVTSAASVGSMDMMMNFTTNLISLLLLIFSSGVPVIINAMEPLFLDTYPNFILVYISHHYSPQCVLALTALIYYIKHPPFRKFIWLEILNRTDNS
jgi:hypothetical protein